MTLRRPASPLWPLALTVLASLTLLAACARPGGPKVGGPSGGTEGLVGRTFLSTSVTHGGQDKALASGTRISVQFTADGRLLAQPGCNQMQGTVRTDGGRITVADLMTTDMACADQARMDQDTWFANLLQGGPRWTLTGDTLVLTGAEDVVTLLDRRVAQPDQPLVKTHWIIDTIFTASAASSATNVTGTIDFQPDATVVAYTVCQVLTGSAAISGDTVTFGPLTGTSSQPCPTTQADLNGAVHATLQGTIHWKIEADRLTLTRPDGSGLGLHAK